jgi:hypothetical protein
MCFRPCFLIILFLTACASRVLQYERAAEILKTEEYDKRLQVKVVEPPPPVEVKEIEAKDGKDQKIEKDEKNEKKDKDIASGKDGKDSKEGNEGDNVPESIKSAKKKAKLKVTPVKGSRKNAKKDANKDLNQPIEPKGPGPRQPELEDTEGFTGRRPIKDPFRIGEVTTLSLSYFNIVAGVLDLAVKPMVEVNGQRAYHLEVNVKSNSFFNHIYGVDDRAVTYMTYNDLIPLNLEITIKETKQLAEARTFFDWNTLKANYWQKRITKDHGEEKKQVEWNILPYSQNVISAVFYLRTFSYALGKKLAFRVADEGKNIVFKGEVIRKERLSTDIGELDTIVMKPQLTVDGVFTPVGEILIWLTDDDRKFIVRIESKIKIGTIVAKLKSLEKGRE